MGELYPVEQEMALRAILWKHLGGDSQYEAIRNAIDDILGLPPVKQSDGLAERVREACAKVADGWETDDAVRCAVLMGMGEDEIFLAQKVAKGIASIIRSLDITRMDSDG